ncbi:hypothetical protein Taro_030443 [Colocasia esculenta]|uniref:Uncharacterized protein n=1 Tax=Colocasia esculenta TaxID=4460 RepID=A0A843VRX6_COLES|nr:hypothetical protein [Colocasia esculenta]
MHGKQSQEILARSRKNIDLGPFLRNEKAEMSQILPRSLLFDHPETKPRSDMANLALMEGRIARIGPGSLDLGSDRRLGIRLWGEVP